MQSSLLLRSRGLSLAKCPSLSLARTSARAMGSYATFKVPRIDNEPNVSYSQIVVIIKLTDSIAETLRPRIS